MHGGRAMVRRHRPHLSRALVDMRHGLSLVARGDPVFRNSEPTRSRYTLKFLSQLCAMTTSSQADSIAAKPVRILVQAAAETLIRNVDERYQPTLDDQPGHLAPIAHGRGRHRSDCDSSRGARRRPPARPTRSAAIISSKRIDRLTALVIGIFDHLETRRADHRRMIGPGRRANQDACVRIDRRDQLEAEPERARSRPASERRRSARRYACSPSRIGRRSSAKRLSPALPR